MRTLLRAAGLSMLLAPPVWAGDFATLEPIGFSEDGSVFAYEQYGIQDGSGFPYSEIFFVDLDDDRYLAPSPVRVRLDDGGAELAQAREEARVQAGALFEEHRPENDPGLSVASNPPTELTADPHRIVFLPRPIEPSIDEPVELRLSLKPIFDLPGYCSDFGQTGMGFRLTRVGVEPGAETTVLHEDERLPESRARNCPFDYRLAEVRVHGATTGEMRAVAIIGVKQVGFEGPDMRYIAVPVPLD